jgi:hypothetical protein
MIGQSCLHSPAKTVVERQSQPTGSSLSAPEPRQIARKPRGRTVLLAVTYYAKDPCAALNPSNMPLMALDRAPSKVIQSICLQSPTSPCPLVPSSLTSGVSYSVCRMLNKSFGGSNPAICHSHVGRYRPFSSQISSDQGGGGSCESLIAQGS